MTPGGGPVGGEWQDGIPKGRAWLERMTRQGEDAIWRGATDALRVFNALTTQNGAYRQLNASLESEIAIHRAKANAYHAAITSLDSERQANALLTDEIERLASLLPARRGAAWGG